jgi:hypothetical protein
MSDIDAAQPSGDPGAQRTAAGPGESDAELFVRDAIEHLHLARRAPLSANYLVDRDVLLDLLERSLEAFPDEIRQARWLLKEGDEVRQRAEREGEEIIRVARGKAELMVSRTEVVKAAELYARRTVEAAESEARRLRHEVEDFCDQKLASFEIILDKTAKLVQQGRERMQQGVAKAAEGGVGVAVEADRAVDALPAAYDAEADEGA